jgi:hypothetical protein
MSTASKQKFFNFEAIGGTIDDPKNLVNSDAISQDAHYLTHDKLYQLRIGGQKANREFSFKDINGLLAQ